MKVYRLDVSEVQSNTLAVISSSVGIRTNRKQEFYASFDKAQTRRQEIQDSLAALIGYTANFEVTVTTIEVIE